MAVDVAPLLELVATLADELERDYGPDVELVVGIVAVELLPARDAADVGPALEEDVEAEDLGAIGSIIEHRSTVRSTAHVLGAVELLSDSLRDGYTRD